MQFDESRKQWGVTMDTGGVVVFHECYVDPVVPDTLSHRVRPCSGKTTINSCPENYTNETIKELCQSYTGLIFEPNTAYRNVHCAICNGANLEKLICLNLGPYGRNNWQQTFNTFSFAVLFDLSGEESNSVGFEKGPCVEGELYDPFFKKCRNVICGSPDQKYVKGKCVSISTSKETEFSSTTEVVTLEVTTEPFLEDTSVDYNPAILIDGKEGEETTNPGEDLVIVVDGGDYVTTVTESQEQNTTTLPSSTTTGESWTITKIKRLLSAICFNPKSKGF
jgi:hypothetical protein